MATRPGWTVENGQVVTRNFEFVWNGGFAVSQKKKNVVALHQAISDSFSKKALEVSTKSEVDLGQNLSAFRLKLGQYYLENVFQSAKVYQQGGPYLDLLLVEPKESKRDSRHKESGSLTHFDHLGERWELSPTTAFYDYIYIKSVQETFSESQVEHLRDYDYFTDIEFNPSKSVNSQGGSVAILRYLLENHGYGTVFTRDSFLNLHREIVPIVPAIKE